MKKIIFLHMFCLISSVIFAGPFDEGKNISPDSTSSGAILISKVGDFLPVYGSTQELIDFYAKQFPNDPTAALNKAKSDLAGLGTDNKNLQEAIKYWQARAEVQNAKGVNKLGKFISVTTSKPRTNGTSTTASGTADANTLRGALHGLVPPSPPKEPDF
ncbi:MAG: hypothetical protein HQM08_07340 [Candidatus Riflebacteria bacterium]|nr:hypothetical protein [Candidatus Riflebacteria bacterium]